MTPLIQRKLPGIYESPNFTIHYHSNSKRKRTWEVQASTSAGRAVFPEKIPIASLQESKEWVFTAEAQVVAWIKRHRPWVISADLSNARMAAENEQRYSKVVQGGWLRQWVGIGWPKERVATEADYMCYPTVLDHEHVQEIPWALPLSVPLLPLKDCEACHWQVDLLHEGAHCYMFRDDFPGLTCGQFSATDNKQSV